MPSAPSLSLRLTPEADEKLSRAASLTRKPRSALAKEAIDKYLDVILANSEPVASPLSAKIRAYAGIGARDGGRSKEDIDRQIREFRGDD